jgi:preprotein translocase subunit SecY
MISGAQNIFKIPELKRRILFSFLFLAIYRIGVHIPTPGINGDALLPFYAGEELVQFIDMFPGA